jgi:arylsulfatase A-like enzyme
VHAVDWVPTLTKLAGYRPDADAKWDGSDMWPVIAGTAKQAPRELYWKGPNGRASALRSGDWKLVVLNRKTELYNLGDDPYEQRDRAQSEPATVARLEALLAKQQASDDDAVPPRPKP